ncbi:MAG: InlB B-repeat-containing protein, partial [Clostridia bacterium]|nr:InlB B-repeat-containing protein [Clostridia bacterium]
MKMAKRALAVVLSLVMAFSVFSIVGSAAMNTTTVYNGNENTMKQGLDIFKVVDGTPVETELTSGTNLEPGDVIEVRVKIGTDFYAQSVSNHVCYDSTMFALYLDGARYTTIDTGNYKTETGFFKTYEDSVQTVDGLTWYDTLMSDANNGRTGTTNTLTGDPSSSIWKGAKNTYTPMAWKEGGKASGNILSDYANYHFVSTKYVSSSDSPASGQLIKVPYDTYFSFQLQVLDDAATAEGATTSVWIPYEAIKTTSKESSNKVTAETNGTNQYSSTGVVGYGHTVDLTDGEVEFTIGAGAVVEPTEQYTVTFVAGDNGALEGTTEVTVDEGTAFADIALPTAVADAGYKFAGWTGAPETITADVTVTANFEYDAEQWATVTFAAGQYGSIADAEAVTVLKGTDASAIEFPEATAEAGYKFAGWDLTGTINADVTATATFEYDADQWVTVKFVAGENGTISGQTEATLLKGTPIEVAATLLPEAIADPGYELSGWVSEEIGEDATTIDVDATYTAIFEYDPDQWATVTFVAGANGSIAGETEVTVLKGTAWADITFPEATADEGYTFAGWDNAGETVESDATVTASFAATDASVTVNVYTMDTTGDYGAAVTSSFTAAIGSEASVNAADYESEGFYVDTDKSTLSAYVTENGATIEVYVARTVATYTFLVPEEDGSFTQYDQDEYFYGAEVVLPIDPSVDGYTFKGWKTADGADFTGGTAGTADVTVTAVLEVADTSLTEEDLAALNAAIALLPDPENLYYYTDEAILAVAAALGSAETDADAYIAEATASGYVYAGEQSKAAVVAATEAITKLAADINTWVDGKMPNRDESKANINIDVIPVAINGEEVVADADNKIVINKGDIVTFNFNLDTDYYLSALYAQILYDTKLFDVVDVDDYVYTEEQIQNGEAYADYILDVTTDRNISRNYDITCESLNSYDKQYHASVKADADAFAAFKEQYKIILLAVTTKAASASKAFKFDDAFIASFRLQATEDVVYDGTITSLVGVDADWYADADNKAELLAGTRAAGFKADGTTAALNASEAKANYMVYDKFAQYGQTFTSTMANVQFGAAVVPVEEYTVTFVAGDNGSIDGTTEVTVEAGTAWADIDLPKTVADAGYKFAAWENAPETITADVTVTATFEYDAEQWATVTFAAGANGSIADAEAVTVLKGTDASAITFPEATADAGYKFAGWDLTGAIEADVTATATFELDDAQWVTVTFAAGENGSIADAEAVTVLKGTDASEITFPEATPDAGYKFAGWDLTGAIEADVTATASFEYDAEQWATVTFAAGANGSIADAEAVTVLKGTDASEITFPEAT